MKKRHFLPALLLSLATITPAHAATVTTTEDFTATPKNWTVMESKNYGGTHTSYLKENVSFKDGNAEITTKRHCVSPGEVPSKSNVSVAPCAHGKITQYSTGRIYADGLVNAGESFRIDFRAKIDSNKVAGTRPALWLVREDTSYCQNKTWDSLGEFDVMEWYSWNPTTAHSTTHLSCSKDKNGRVGYKSTKSSVKDKNIPDSWHTWSLSYDARKQQVQYLLDGSPIKTDQFWDGSPEQKNSMQGGSYTLGHYGLSKDQLSEILGHDYRVIINDWVENASNSHAPDDGKPFPEQKFLVDRVQITREGTPTPILPAAPVKEKVPQKQGTPVKQTQSEVKPAPSTTQSQPSPSRDTSTTTQSQPSPSTTTRSEVRSPSIPTKHTPSTTQSQPSPSKSTSKTTQSQSSPSKQAQSQAPQRGNGFGFWGFFERLLGVSPSQQDSSPSNWFHTFSNSMLGFLRMLAGL